MSGDDNCKPKLFILRGQPNYNSSPKPFQKSSTGEAMASRPPFGRQANTDYSLPSTSSSIHEEPPKLVHKQYNSPMNLYSMNNIRKTIEAHSELIAPGLMGINFLKNNKPVDKESEVYKLVREQEQESRRSDGKPFESSNSLNAPVSSSPVINIQGAAQGAYRLSNDDNLLRRFGASRSNDQTSLKSLNDEIIGEIQTMNEKIHATGASDGRQLPDSNPDSNQFLFCSECGLKIKGAFARLQKRNVHPDCFNCTTCGTSLKNAGYYILNDKLYCGLHARLVAKTLKIDYDFGHDVNEDQSHMATTTSTTDTKHSEISELQTRPQNIYSRFARPNFNFGPPNNYLHFNQPRNLSDTRSLSVENISGLGCNTTSRQSQFISGFRQQESQSRCDLSGLKTNNKQDVRHRPLATSNQSKYLQVPSTCYGSTARLFTENDVDIARRTLSNKLESNQLKSMSQSQLPASPMMSRNSSCSRNDSYSSGRNVPSCVRCGILIHGPYIMVGDSTWCRECSRTSLICCSCSRSLLAVGFVETAGLKRFCEDCYELHKAPVCSKCSIRIKGDCLNALDKQWHPSCFVCGHCQRPFGNSTFYLEDNLPYCERDWNLLFTTKCHHCSMPIEAGDKWIEALDKSYHLNCFNCSACGASLEGVSFYRKNGKPYCRSHAM